MQVNLIISTPFAVSRPCLYNGMPAHFADSPEMEAIYKMLSVSQPPPAPEVIAKQYRPASVVDKAHINGRYVCTGISLSNQVLHRRGELIEFHCPCHTNARCLTNKFPTN